MKNRTKTINTILLLNTIKKNMIHKKNIYQYILRVLQMVNKKTKLLANSPQIDYSKLKEIF